MASRPGLDGCSEAFAAAVCAMSAPMLITDAREADHPIVFVNDAFCRMTGYARADIIGCNCRFLQGADTDPITVAAIRTAIALGRSVEADILNYRRNGEPFWNRLLITPVNDESGQLTHFVSNSVDITAGRARRSEPQNRAVRSAGGAYPGTARSEPWPAR